MNELPYANLLTEVRQQRAQRDGLQSSGVWTVSIERMGSPFARTDNCQDKSLYLVGCGSFGLSVTEGGRPGGVQVRPMAK